MKKEYGDFLFTKRNTEIVKGAAILLMLFHHLFGFPEWLTDGASYIGFPLRANTLEYVIGKFGHICVALFAFITGYGMYFSYRKGGVFKKSVKKGAEFLVSYWLIMFGIMIPINLMLGKTDLTAAKIFANMFGIENDIVSFAWYVRFYLAVLITLPLFYRLMSERSALTAALFIALPPLARAAIGSVRTDSEFWGQVIYLAQEYFLWIPCVLLGMCFAKYGFFEKTDRAAERLGIFKIPFLIIVLAIIFYMKAYKNIMFFDNLSPDFLYAALFIYILCSLINLLPHFAGDILVFLGGHSMNIWFLHSAFFFRTSELMQYAYLPRFSALIVIWVLLITVPLSCALKFVTAHIFRIFENGSRPQNSHNAGTLHG